MTTLKLSSRRSRNAERQRGELISERCPYFHYHNEMTGEKEKKRKKKTQKNTNVVFGFLSSSPPQADVSLRHFMEWLLSKRRPQLLQTAVSRRWWQELRRGFATPSVVALWEVCARLRPRPSPVEEKNK